MLPEIPNVTTTENITLIMGEYVVQGNATLLCKEPKQYELGEWWGSIAVTQHAMGCLNKQSYLMIEGKKYLICPRKVEGNTNSGWILEFSGYSTPPDGIRKK